MKSIVSKWHARTFMAAILVLDFCCTRVAAKREIEVQRSLCCSVSQIWFACYRHKPGSHSELGHSKADTEVGG
jgi:hypothetical protein